MKKINPIALNSLINALCYIYWYKKDLKTFIINSVPIPSILALIDFNQSKRDIARTLVSLLRRNENEYADILLELMITISNMTDFSHLNKLDDSKTKIRQAIEAVNQLKNLVKSYEEKDSLRKYNRKKMQENIDKLCGTRERLSELKDDYSSILSSCGCQEKGYRLERLMKELFLLFDLDPKASFKNTGEQIDGAFCLEQIDYLFECKWHNKPIGASDLDIFKAKVDRKLDNTLGLFLSINGFTEDGVQAHSKVRPNILLMDGIELVYVLENRITLPDLIYRKKQHAAQTGDIYFKFSL